MPAPRCKTGKHRCTITKQCVSKSTKSTRRCHKGSRKCYNSKCYRKNKSNKSRRNFYKKYGK